MGRVSSERRENQTKMVDMKHLKVLVNSEASCNVIAAVSRGHVELPCFHVSPYEPAQVHSIVLSDALAQALRSLAEKRLVTQ